VDSYARIGFAMGLFFLAAGIVYVITGHEYEGFPLLLMTSGGIVLLGLSALRAIRRARREEARGEEAVEPVEPHVVPTIWPFLLAVSAVVVAIGFLTTTIVLAIGVGFLIVSGAGWFQDVRRQWRHPPAPAPPGTAPSPTTE
jgi:hypothetical protein